MVLNNRGLDLAHSDIRKSEIIGKIYAAEQEKYGKLWENTEESLGREPFVASFTWTNFVRRVKCAYAWSQHSWPWG